MTAPSSPPPSLLATLRTRMGAPPPLDEAFHHSIEQAIEKAETQSGAEIVLVVRTQSGSYRDICWLFGAVVAWLGLWGIIFAHFDVHPWAVLLDTLLIFCFASWVCGRTSIRRWLCTRKRLDRQTTDGLRLALFEEGIMETPSSTGILVYWSRLEQRIETCADSGVERQLPPAAWHAFQFALRQAEHEVDPRIAIVAAIECLSEQLAKYVPIPDGHVRILPNRPRANP
jgi:uncharacterized membrane protein